MLTIIFNRSCQQTDTWVCKSLNLFYLCCILTLHRLCDGKNLLWEILSGGRILLEDEGIGLHILLLIRSLWRWLLRWGEHKSAYRAQLLWLLWVAYGVLLSARWTKKNPIQKKERKKWRKKKQGEEKKKGRNISIAALESQRSHCYVKL